MFNEYPYVNLQDVNLDWILKHIKDLETNLQDFVKLNTIKYADPIIWNITKQYETNTVVIDGNTGTAYLSVQPVPAGVALTNTDYWTVIFTLNLTTSNQNITFRDDGTNVVATFASNTGDWLLWNFYLYRVTQPIAINTAYVEGFNIERYSVELFIRDYINTLTEIIGDLNDLTTSDKTSIVEAVNSLVTVIGNLDDLTTSDKTSIVEAVNSLVTVIGDLDDLTTSDKTSIVEAINSLVTDINNLNPDIFVSPKFYGAEGDGITDDTAAIQACINANDYVVFDGDFLITDTITLHSNMYILGMGEIINTAEFKTGLYGENVSNLIIDGVSFVNGSRSGSAHTTENGNIFIYNGNNILIRNIKDTEHNKMASILLDTVTNFEITSCLILKSGYSGIMCYGNCKDGNIHHNRVEVDNYTLYANSYGIALSCTPHVGSPSLSSQCVDVIIDSNILWTVDNHGHWEGIDTHGGLRIKVTNNKLKGFAYAIRLIRYNDYDDPTDGSPHNCVVSGNDIQGASTLTAARSSMYGIHIAGNENVFTNCVVSNNSFSDMWVTQNGVPVGTGIYVNGDSIVVDGNTFHYQMVACVELRLMARCIVSNNDAMMTQGDFINLNDIRGGVIIKDNAFSQANNFYNIISTAGLSDVNRDGNVIRNAYWKDNTPNVTDITDFVPDYVNVSPAGSNYHPRGMTAIKSIPASGSPEKWVCDGTTWRASANLT